MKKKKNMLEKKVYEKSGSNIILSHQFISIKFLQLINIIDVKYKKSYV